MSTAAKTPNYNLSQVAGSDIPDWITDYTSDMLKIDDALKGNADDIATVRPDEFSEESTYAAGDYCIKDNVIYKAKTAVEAGAFDISDWTATTIFDELSGLNQNMNSRIPASINILNTYSHEGTTNAISIDKTHISNNHQIILFDDKGANVFNIAADWSYVTSQSNKSQTLTIGDDYVTISGVTYYQVCTVIILY